MAARVEEGRRRHEAELAAAERLAWQARTGSAPGFPPPVVAAPRRLEPGEFIVDTEWRGETAWYVESDRRVRLSCYYWGGPLGRVSHIDGRWEYGDGRTALLSADERAMVLQRTIERVRRDQGIVLQIESA
jgi:hypothetical protein